MTTTTACRLRPAAKFIAAVLVACTCHSVGAQNSFVETILVANKASYRPTVMVDENLIDAWGIALRPPGIGGHIWLANAGSGTTTTYIGDVGGVSLYQDGLKVIPIQAALGAEPGSAPGVSGQVYNAASDISGQPIEFAVSGPAVNWSNDPATPTGISSGAAKFVFVTIDGTINAWRANTANGMREAVIVKDFSETSTTPRSTPYVPAYTGVAMTSDAFRLDASGRAVADNRLYAADFANNRIQVFDNQWNDVSSTVSFERPADLQLDFMPFNIQFLGGRLYVAYAESAEEASDRSEQRNVPGAGRIVAYDRQGHIVKDFSNQLPLNAPWGFALAPAGFGAYGGKLLVGNFGSGSIAAYDPDSGDYLGDLLDAAGQRVLIDGLWGIAFGNGTALGDANSLYFAAGPNREQDGIFGKLTVSPVPEPASIALFLVGLASLLTLRQSRSAGAPGRRSVTSEH